MPKTILFLALTRNSPTIEEQRVGCAAPGDLIVEAGKVSLVGLAERLVRKRIGWEPGDILKLYDLACIDVSTSTLTRILDSTLDAGVGVEICCPGVKIAPGDDTSDTVRLLRALDAHWRRIHGVKTKDGTRAKPGRKPRLQEHQLSAIRTMVAAPGATTSGVARELSIGRTTLFAYLKRHGLDPETP